MYSTIISQNLIRLSSDGDFSIDALKNIEQYDKVI